jgi:hypothetical protein
VIYLYVRSQKGQNHFSLQIRPYPANIRLATPASFPSTLELFLACSFLPLSSLLDCQTTQAGLAAPKLPQPGVNLIDIAAQHSVCSSRVSTTILVRKAQFLALCTGIYRCIPRLMYLRVHESLQYGPYFLLYFKKIPCWDKLSRYKYIPLIPCYTVIYLVGQPNAFQAYCHPSIYYLKELML